MTCFPQQEQHNKLIKQKIIIQLMSTKEQFRSNGRRDQLINQQRKKLEQLRLQTESQNTKLLKIQQREREVQTEYQNEKKNMQQTLAKLALEAQNFMNKQASTTHQFQSQKQQIFANDRKKQMYLKQKGELQASNVEKKNNIMKIESVLAVKKKKLAEIREEIKKHQIYEDFLKEVKGLSEDFSSGEFDQVSVMAILDRYATMKKKKQQLSQVSKNLQQQKDKKVKRILAIKKEREEKVMQWSKKIKDLKESIDKYSQQNIQLSSELEGKLNQNGERQREVGQIIFSIRGLYLSIVGEEKNKKNIYQMLDVIREERKKLREYLEEFQNKSSEKSKN